MNNTSENYKSNKRYLLVQGGKARFVKRYGIMYFGLPMAVVFLLIFLFTSYDYTGHHDIITLLKLVVYILINVVCGLLAGISFGLFMWYYVKNQKQ